MNLLDNLLKSFFNTGIIFHYELDLNSIRFLDVKIPFKNKIFLSLDDVPDTVFKKILKEFRVKNTEIFSSKITDKSKLVISFLDEDIASYCFFGFREQKFKFFSLGPEELYFFDCFTFPEYRGLGAICSEVSFVVNKFKEIGYKKANVQIESFNTNSIKAFSKIGFHKTREYQYIRILFFERVKEKVI
jgi:RimJ/RimL family protein N-acetyltransferase